MFGAGLLVGAALAIIIPEGVSTILSLQPHTAESLPEIVEQPAVPVLKPAGNADSPGGAADKNHPGERALQAVLAETGVENARVPHAAKADANLLGAHEHGTHEHGSGKAHNLIGVALTLGFVLMFLVDQMSGGCLDMCAICCRTCFGRLPCCRQDTFERFHGPSDVTDLARAEHSAFTTTLGLVVHSIADGIAIGAAFDLTFDLTLVLFVAIMLHKAPAAFGFVSFLVHEGLPRNRVRTYLFIFALASPLGAIGTYLSLLLHGYLEAHAKAASGALAVTAVPSTTGTGFVLLVSGGTFLYVAAAHILPQLASENAAATSAGQSSCSPAGSRSPSAGHTVKPLETLAFVLGSFIPVLISFGHSH
uniref:Zinc transporter ZIP9 n=2 Tax=Schistocephalus solidus TaxID=70667 RepID=A0A0X3PRG7_SCHSO